MLQQASARRKKIATILAFSCIPLSGFFTDIYLPSFPSMAKDLNVSADRIQLTLTCFFMSYGLGQMFVGSLLDSLGRYKPAMISLVVMLFSSLIIANTRSVELICALRIVQGVSTAFLIVAKRALFVEMYEGDERKNYLSYFTIVWSLGPIIAPFLGGFLQQLFNWQANFYFLALYTFVLLVLELIFSGETLIEKKKFDLQKIRRDYVEMLSNAPFLIGIVILGLSYSVVMVFNIAGPFVIEHSFHHNSVVIGYCTLILGFSWMIGGIIGKRLVAVDFNKKILVAGSTQLVLTILLMVAGLVMHSLWGFMFFAFLIHICSGLLYTIFFTQNILAFPQHAGLAGGLIGGLVYVITSFSGYVLSQTGKMETQGDISLRYMLMSLMLSLVVVGLVRWKQRQLRKPSLSL
ncbi:Bcr/CflA subfamily drug resistance transporter [Chitinophaga skermanii]|uniref:Bcr/CflA subfamily drug resistance transporter n=1 Tax=Chitinophaga skermanii TaxID=331697 RepID=A0A327R5D6_9BACT|nr:MFS transporter [Chitinophaga skermanii]RAJ11182.1 Bcr/CflA subfamily drug resistance transporter [Chitinophaga skermanii]